MLRFHTACLVTLIAALLPASSALAQASLAEMTGARGGEPDEKFHIEPFAQPVDFSIGCDNFDDLGLTTCASLNSAPGQAGLTYLWFVCSYVGGYPDGYAGVEFGIEHDGLPILSWNPCGLAINSPLWPNSGGWTAVVTSGPCIEPASENVSVGFLLLEDGDQGSIMLTGLDDVIQRDAHWVDCPNFQRDVCVQNLGALDLAAGGTATCAQCMGGTPVDDVSWGAIKSSF